MGASQERGEKTPREEEPDTFFHQELVSRTGQHLLLGLTGQSEQEGTRAPTLLDPPWPHMLLQHTLRPTREPCRLVDGLGSGSERGGPGLQLRGQMCWQEALTPQGTGPSSD